MLRILLTAVLVAFSGLAIGQQPDRRVSPAATKKLEKARIALNKQDLVEARDQAERLTKQYPDWPEAWKFYAEVSQSEGNDRASEHGLKRLVGLDSAGYPEAYRWIAEYRFRRGDYTNAGLNFNKFLQLSKDTGNLTFRTRLLKSSISFALSQTGQPGAIMPEKLAGPVNTAKDEYFPSLSADGSVLVFTRQDTQPVENGKAKPEESLFYVKFRDSAYGDPQPFPYPINTPGNEGTQSLRQDGRVMFFTACSRPDTKGGCDLYYCIKTGDHWSDPVNLGNPVNTRYWESTPFLAQDDRHLFFSSNRPGGSGGMDIWVTTLQPDRSWSAPKNLGPAINTPLDEMSPLLLVDGKTFFFASNGHPGMGGFDLFHCDLSNPASPSVPVNLGFGINTFRDEDGLTVNADNNLGLFASNRDSAAGKDIYQVDMSRFVPGKGSFTLSGIVRDRVTGKTVGARIEVMPHGDSLVSSADADPVTGEYLLGVPERASYRIGASMPGYLPYSYYLANDTTAARNKIRHMIDLEPIRAGASIVLQNIFFSVDSYDLLPESYRDLEEVIALIRQNPGIVMEVSGYTDSTGSDDHNLVLSQKRAESVMNYLAGHGVNAGQLKAVGYGRQNPVAPNDTEAGRSLNRRTELKVIRMR
jgi:outer membrane protein OmpA-like peptidoglycan-associated protein